MARRKDCFLFFFCRHATGRSDLDWSCFEAEFLVSSSVDTYMYIWDIR